MPLAAQTKALPVNFRAVIHRQESLPQPLLATGSASNGCPDRPWLTLRVSGVAVYANSIPIRFIKIFMSSHTSRLAAGFRSR